MKEEKEKYEEGYQENDNERQFGSRLQKFAKNNPEKVQQIVNESAWGKKQNQKIVYQKQTLFEALGLE